MLSTIRTANSPPFSSLSLSLSHKSNTNSTASLLHISDKRSQNQKHRKQFASYLLLALLYLFSPIDDIFLSCCPCRAGPAKRPSKASTPGARNVVLVVSPQSERSLETTSASAVSTVPKSAGGSTVRSEGSRLTVAIRILSSANHLPILTLLCPSSLRDFDLPCTDLPLPRRVAPLSCCASFLSNPLKTQSQHLATGT